MADIPKYPDPDTYSVTVPSEPLSTAQDPPSPAAEAVWSEHAPRPVLPWEGEGGWTVVVPTKAAIKASVPAPEHYPYIWIDVYTGESLNRTRYPWGRAQQYGSGDFSNVEIGTEDFIRLADVQGLRVRLSNASGSPGTCSLTIQNALVGKERGDGTWYWERRQFKPGRFIDGATVRYIDRRPSLLRGGELWYRGRIHGTLSAASADVILDDKPYRVIWEGDGGPGVTETDFQAGGLERTTDAEGREETIITARGSRYRGSSRLDPSCFFVEDEGEPIFEPMQKIRIFGMNRFPPEKLVGFPYRLYSGPGGEKPVGEDRQVISSETDYLSKFRPRQLTVNGKLIPEVQMLQYTGEAAYHYATPLFTGFVSDVTSEQQGPNWVTTVACRDVTCWLDYSQLNVSPSLNIFNADLISEAELKNWQIYTSRFETMPAHEIVRALYLGLREAYVIAQETITDFALLQAQTMYPEATTAVARAVEAGEVQGAYLYYQRPQGDINTPRFRETGEGGRPIVLPHGTRVYIRGSWPEEGDPEWYYIATSDGRLGWVDANDLGKVQSTYTGVGHFKEVTDPTTTLVPIGLAVDDIKKMFAFDKLILNPSIEPGTDGKAVGAYEKYMRQNWPLVQSEYVSRRSIISQVTKHSNCECYADGDGRVWFHPVRAYYSVTDPVYIIHPEETISWAFTFSDREIITWAHVHGEWSFNLIPGEFIYGQVMEDIDMLKRFGVRAIHVSNPNIKTSPAARTFARSLLKRVNANKITGTVTIIFRPEVQLARNVYVPWLNVVGYVSNIDHNIQWGRAATTTLSLRYVRHPWEPWSPLEYDKTKEVDNWSTLLTRSNPDRGRAPASTRAVPYDQEQKGGASVPVPTPDESESKHKMRDYVHRAFLEGARAIHRNLNARCSVFKGRDPTGSEIWKRGIAIKVAVSTMDTPGVPGPEYTKTAMAASFNLIIATFREAGFRVINNYRSTARWEASDTRGHLVLIYSNPPPADIVPESEL